MREFEGDGLVVSASLGSFQLEAELVELDRQELDRHVAVEGLCVGPALHSVFVGHLLVDAEECVKLIVVDVSILEGNGVNNVMDAGEDLAPFPFMCLN